jgi:hypothetical protein
MFALIVFDCLYVGWPESFISLRCILPIRYILTGKPPNTQPYTVNIYDFGQPYLYGKLPAKKARTHDMALVNLTHACTCPATRWGCEEVTEAECAARERALLQVGGLGALAENTVVRSLEAGLELCSLKHRRRWRNRNRIEWLTRIHLSPIDSLQSSAFISRLLLPSELILLKPIIPCYLLIL